MTGQFIGRVVSRHERGFGWLVDETAGSAKKGTTIFFHPNHIVGAKYLAIGAKVTFDVVDDTQHPGKLMAVNIAEVVR